MEALRAHCAGDPRSLVLIHVFDSTNSSSGQRNLHSLLSTLICQLALNDAHCASIISKSRKAIVANGLPTKVRMEMSPTYKCGIGYDTAFQLAKDLGIKINDLIWDPVA